MAGIKIVHVPYKGSADSTIAVVGGHVQFSFSSAAAVMPHVKSGKLKPLAVTSAESSALAPGMPTVAASGLPGFEAGTIYSVLAPVKTPAAIVGQLNREIVLVLSGSETKGKLLDGGIEAGQQLAGAVVGDDVI